MLQDVRHTLNSTLKVVCLELTELISFVILSFFLGSAYQRSFIIGLPHYFRSLHAWSVLLELGGSSRCSSGCPSLLRDDCASQSLISALQRTVARRYCERPNEVPSAMNTSQAAGCGARVGLGYPDLNPPTSAAEELRICKVSCCISETDALVKAMVPFFNDNNTCLLVY